MGKGELAMRESEAMLPRLIQSLALNAREIDQIFAQAGGQLGEGLSLFEGLKQRLSTLSAELGGPEIAQAGATLGELAGALRAIGGSIAAEMRALKELATPCHEAALTLERLLEQMRLITILARSARIEAVCVQGRSGDFGDFTSEIVTLTTQGQRTIKDCAREHERLSHLLGTALAAQRAFEERYGAALLALADRLERTLAEVATRQQRSIAVTRQAAEHSGKIAIAAGGAIIALQSGDSIRQRLEHAIAALKLLAMVEAGSGDAADWQANERQAAAALLRRLEAAQLEAGAAALADDAAVIETALALLAGDTSGLLDLVHALYSGEGGTSFMAGLEADLAQASTLLGLCDKARGDIDRVTQALTGVLETCRNTVISLSDSVSSIVLIGLNAGLRAARLGTDGRSLVVIAQELKLAADQVATAAARLTPSFDRMQAAAACLTETGRPDAAHFAALDQAMRAALGAMRHSGERLGETLCDLSRDGTGFHAVLAQASLSFSNAGATSDVIAAAAAQLTRGAGAVPSSPAGERAGQWLRHQVWPRYTMAAERDTHHAILAEQGLDAGTDVVTVVSTEETLEDFLF